LTGTAVFVGHLFEKRLQRLGEDRLDAMSCVSQSGFAPTVLSKNIWKKRQKSLRAHQIHTGDS